MDIHSFYEFTRTDTDPISRYALTAHYGEDFENFPPVYKNGIKKGKQYIGLRKTMSYVSSRLYQYMLELNDSRTFTGFNDTDFENKSFGDSRSINVDDVVLIETDKKYFIRLYFVERKGRKAKDIFNEWVKSEV